LVDTVPDLTAALNRLMVSRDLATFSIPETAAMIGDGVTVLVGRAFAARGGTPDGAAMADFTRDYAAHLTDGSKPFEGVPEFLRVHAEAGWRMAVCTNKVEAAAKQLLRAMNLTQFIVAVGGGDSFPVRKPNPEHLLATLRLAGGDAASTVMVGDHANDVAAARGAGVKSVFVTWGYGAAAMAAGADGVANDLPELSAALERLVPVGS
jgi:phosphoglycolate phosphatase